MSEVKRVPKNSMLMETYSSLAHSTLQLFNAVPVHTTKKKNPSKDITRITTGKGFILSPQVIGNYTQDEITTVIRLVSDEIGLSPEQMNSSFHKS